MLVDGSHFEIQQTLLPRQNVPNGKSSSHVICVRLTEHTASYLTLVVVVLFVFSTFTCQPMSQFAVINYLTFDLAAARSLDISLLSTGSFDE